MLNPDKFCRARLVERIDFADDLAAFRFEPDAALPFTPGQYCTIGRIGDNGRPVLRAYSIVSAPHENCLELFVELVPEGELTPMLWPLQVGDDVWVRRKIVGKFVLDTSVRRHVMAATVTGAAPFLSMARAQRHALAEGTIDEPHHLLVIHGASHSHEFGVYHDELKGFEADGWLTYVPTVSRPWSDPEWTGEVGRVEDVLRKHMDALGWAADETAGYACGNPQMIDNALGILRRSGVPDERAHEEKYFTESAPTAPAKPAVSAPASVPKPRPAPPAFAPTLRAVKPSEAPGAGAPPTA